MNHPARAGLTMNPFPFYLSPHFPYLSRPNHTICNEKVNLFIGSCFTLRLCLCTTNEYTKTELPLNP